MADQMLRTFISINAQANGFGQVGATLTELGSLVDGISQKLIDFGKESIDVYKDYEKSMHEAEVALSTSHGRNTKELAAAMDTLNAKATEWAATTIFHTDDVANAINQAAHAGWSLDEILNGIPVAMQLAQAGSMDLSDALTYITKSMSAFGVPFDELGEFVDMWVYAANSSVGDVQDFGDAMKKMGATMRFTDSKEELFALIGLMHDMGESGSTAATLLRTSMMRIIAPSGVASKVMEQLGATDDEINAIREDASKLQALQLLSDYGFNAFNEDNQAKPMIQIYAELGEVLAQIAGGYDNITKNQTTLGILSTIFGTRGITGALDIVTALQNAVDLRDKLLAGNAEGYGEYAQETMMDTLYGKTEMFESKIERLKQVVGEELSTQLESVMESVGGIVDDIAEMDEGRFSALVSGISVIAGAGPALLLAGGAFRLIGTLLTPAGGIGLGLIALTAAATAIEKMQQADLRDTFGEMEIDKEGITSYVQSLASDFQAAYTYTNYFQEALNKAVENYRTASSTFSSNIFSMMITDAKLTPQDLEGLLSLAEDVQKYAQEALYTAASGDAQYWKQLFGDDAVNDPIYQSIIEKTYAAYDEDKEKLEGIGESMKDAILKAFDNDNAIDETEYNEILGWFRKYNEAVARAAAEAQSEEQRITMRKWLLQAQTGGFDDINELSKTASAERDQLLQQENDLYLDKLARLVEHGGTREEQERVKYEHEQRLNEIGTKWDEFQMTLWDSQLSNNGQMENWAALKDLADQYTSGALSSDEALKAVTSMFGKSIYAGQGLIFNKDNARSQLAKITGYMLTALGGEEGVQSKIDYYTKQGNTEMAERLKQLYAMEQLTNGFFDILRTEPLSLFGLNIDMFGEYETNQATGSRTSGRNKQEFEDRYTSENRSVVLARQEISDLKLQIAEAEGIIAGTVKRPWDYNLNNGELKQKVRLYGNYWLGEFQGGGLYDQLAAAEERLAAILAGDRGSETGLGGQPAIPIRAADTGEGAADKWTQLEEQGVDVRVTADSTELETTIEAADGQKLTEYLAGDATDLHYAIWDENGQQLIENVAGNTSELAKAIMQYNGQIVRVKIYGQKMFAAGGRATEESIFGDAGPEWAIPEAHTERTASLLNAARAASGFTWDELLARFGGLNANTGHTPTTLVYSPTINAQDVRGVERALEDDKRRFEKWFKDQKMREEAEVYA